MMIGRKVKYNGRTGVIIRNNGMCYDVRMNDNGEILSGGKKRWKVRKGSKGVLKTNG